MSSPYVKAKAFLEGRGYLVGKTEHWNAFAHIRQDLYGCIDCLCLRAGSPLLAVQVTDSTSVSKRMKKAQTIAQQWVSTGARFQVIGYTPTSKTPPRVMEMQPDGTWADVSAGSRTEATGAFSPHHAKTPQ